MGSDNLKPLRFVIVDDHEIVLDSMVRVVQHHYPEAEILAVLTANQALDLVEADTPDAIIVDLSIPESTPVDATSQARVEVGVQLLTTLMERFPTLNIMVQSAHVQALVRLKPSILAHQGGFTIANKSQSMEDMLTKFDWALKGLNYLPSEMRSGLELKPEWLDVLVLAFQQGLQDKAIAAEMNIAHRTVRNYWSKIQDALGVYPEEGKNIRIQTEIRAREEGLID
ncbi:response regulator receiver protein [filamentous cyanobacterium CCT1]|nr:response regulator receiver protein [filamentous cyanobacterium CCT1]PSN76788.1 response regulator receiver protein [filamentous cyanobacterium CCP4]